MSHMVAVSITDCQNLEKVLERLEEMRDSEEDEAEITPWVATLNSILDQAEEDGR